MTINGLHHAAISTPDIERLMKWYTENFGFEEVARTEWDGYRGRFEILEAKLKDNA